MRKKRLGMLIEISFTMSKGPAMIRGCGLKEGENVLLHVKRSLPGFC